MGDTTRVVVPKRFGLKYDPPQVVLEYLEPSTGKLFHRVMGLSKLKADTDPVKVALKLKEKNEAYLSDEKVSTDQLVSLIAKLQKRRTRVAEQEGGEATTAPSSAHQIGNGIGSRRSESSRERDWRSNEAHSEQHPLTSSNLNALNAMTEDERRAKDKRTKEFLNDLPPLEQIPPIDPTITSSSFGGKDSVPPPVVGAKERSSPSSAAWTKSPAGGPGGASKSPNSTMAEHMHTTTTAASSRTKPHSSSHSKQDPGGGGKLARPQDGVSANPSAAASGVPGLPGVPRGQKQCSKDSTSSSKQIGIDGFDYDSFDLNKLSKEEVQKHKFAMDKHFEANRIKPGDPGYIYDVRKDFRESPHLDNDWDDEESVDIP
ncbi:unnamed protein product [Amoebophrya sp. A25]|nr:unnamed protein product [Amoebophrya sp. A25]|eukprot:GSA25T00011395001.1